VRYLRKLFAKTWCWRERLLDLLRFTPYLIFSTALLAAGSSRSYHDLQLA
jgi:hypothetical protein